MLATSWLYQPLEYMDTDPLWVDGFSDMGYLAVATASLLPAINSSHVLVTLKLRIARGEQLGLVVGLVSVCPGAFEILAVKSYGAVHCLNRILDDNDPRYISTGDLILEASGWTDPTATIDELLHCRYVSLTMVKPWVADISSIVYAPSSESGSCDEVRTVLTPLQLFSPTPDLYSPRSICDDTVEPAFSGLVYSDHSCC